MEEQMHPVEQEIDIAELLRKLLKEWKLILKWCCVAAVVGLIVGFSVPKQYSVSTMLAPELSSKSSGSLCSLAGLAGINLSSLNTTEAVFPDLYPNIVSSTPFIVELFSAPMEFKKGKESISTDLYDYYKNYTRSPWWGYIVKAPFKALSWFLGLFRPKEDEIEGYSNLNPEELTYEQGEIAKAIRESISVLVDKKTAIITVTVTTQNPYVSARISQELIDKLQLYVTTYRTQKARKDLEYYQELYDEAQAEYYDAQQKYAKYVDSNQRVSLLSVRTEQDRLQNEMNLNYQLYNSCAQQLQVAKAKVQQETPVYAVINPPEVPLKSTTSKLKTLILSIFLGLCLSAFWVIFAKDWFTNFRKEFASK